MVIDMGVHVLAKTAGSHLLVQVENDWDTMCFVAVKMSLT